MQQEWIWLALTFVVIAGLSFLALRRGRRADHFLDTRLQGAGEGPEPGSTDALVLGELTPALAAQIPISDLGESELRNDLRAAGYYRPSAVMEYKAIRTVLVLVPLFAGGFLALGVDRPKTLLVLLGTVFSAMFGYSIPRVILYFRAKARSRMIERGLPVAVDLLTLCLTAGQNILGALQRVSRDLKYSYPVLAQELEIVHHQAALRSPELALQQWTERVQVPEVRNLALLLAQSERLGTDASTALMEFADNFRVTLRQRAEAHANRTSFWMVFPTVSCLFISAVIILVGPAYLDFWQQQYEAKKIMAHENENVRSADSRNGTAVRPTRGSSGRSINRTNGRASRSSSEGDNRGS